MLNHSKLFDGLDLSLAGVGVVPMASQKILGTWDPSSALFLLLEEAGEASLGHWTV